MLDPAHFYKTPRLTWQALYCEYKTKRKHCDICLDGFRLELLPDTDVLLFEKRYSRWDYSGRETLWQS